MNTDMSEDVAESTEKICSQLSAIILDLATARGPSKTFCPSEAARKFDQKEWRQLMPVVRTIAISLWKEEKLRVLQKGVEVDPNTAKGPIRYSAWK